MTGPIGWSGLNVSSWLVWTLARAWPAQPARPRRRAQTPPELEACSPETHAGARCCHGVASFRSQLCDPKRGDNDPEHNPGPAPDRATVVLVSHINRLEQELGILRGERDTAKAAEQALAVQLAGLQVVLDAERKLHTSALSQVAEEKARVEEWKAVADRFAIQAEKLAAKIRPRS